jgi:hypothetical protein
MLLSLADPCLFAWHSRRRRMLQRLAWSTNAPDEGAALAGWWAVKNCWGFLHYVGPARRVRGPSMLGLHVAVICIPSRIGAACASDLCVLVQMALFVALGLGDACRSSIAYFGVHLSVSVCMCQAGSVHFGSDRPGAPRTGCSHTPSLRCGNTSGARGPCHAVPHQGSIAPAHRPRGRESRGLSAGLQCFGAWMPRSPDASDLGGLALEWSQGTSALAPCGAPHKRRPGVAGGWVRRAGGGLVRLELNPTHLRKPAGFDGFDGHAVCGLFTFFCRVGGRGKGRAGPSPGALIILVRAAPHRRQRGIGPTLVGS